MTNAKLKSIAARLCAGGLSFAAASREAGLAKSSLARRLSRGVSAGELPEKLLEIGTVKYFYDRAPAPKFQPGENGDLQRKLKDTRRELNELRKESEEESRISEILGGIVATPAAPPAWVATGGERSGKSSTPVLMMGDWHLGEVVSPDESHGYTFNVELAGQRVFETVNTAIDILRNDFTPRKYPGIVAAMIGDLVSGSIHSELAETDELSVFRSVLVARDLACAAITLLADEFGNVFVPCATGNHGRVFDRRPRAKGYAERNTDWLVYQLIADFFKDDDRVSVAAPVAGEVFFEVHGTRFLLTHGDQIGAKGGDGIIGAIGPVMRGTTKLGRSYASLGKDIDHVLMGHWHHTLYLPNATVNGALKGPDEYALRLLRVTAEDPSQTLMLIHPDHGITYRMAIYLRDEGCPNRDRNEDRGVRVF